jgi:hypothetical protein
MPVESRQTGNLAGTPGSPVGHQPIDALLLFELFYDIS